MKTTKEMIAVMQYYADGGKVEANAGADWFDASYPDWNWEDRDYRIKKEPREAYFVKKDQWSYDVWVNASNQTPGAILFREVIE